jgi:GNAT superfamily N-acetyltransferase
MQTHFVQLATPLRRSFRTMQVAGMLDMPLEDRLTHQVSAEVPTLDDEWLIGAIVGPSGSGKTMLARAAFGATDEPRSWPQDRAIIEVLGDVEPPRSGIKHITRVLIGVGLGSVPTWLKPYHILSGGERFRADLAQAILDPRRPVVVIDEFTSTLDRSLAQTASMAVARLMRRGINTFNSDVPRRLVVLTCHTDVLPWLAPDWVVELSPTGSPRLTRRPYVPAQLQFVVERVPQSLWRGFASEHYLSSGLAASATCYAALLASKAGHEPATRPIAFCAVAATLGCKHAKRIARLVTLPEFQGLGIGGRLLDAVAARESQRAARITITASHPAILAHCSASSSWRFIEMKKTGSTRQRYQGRNIRCSTGRAVASFRYSPA